MEPWLPPAPVSANSCAHGVTVSPRPTPASPSPTAVALRDCAVRSSRSWATATTAQHVTDQKTIRHPEVGDLRLDCDVLIVPGADLRVVTYTAAAAAPDAGKLDLLRVTGSQTVTT